MISSLFKMSTNIFNDKAWKGEDSHFHFTVSLERIIAMIIEVTFDSYLPYRPVSMGI